MNERTISSAYSHYQQDSKRKNTSVVRSIIHKYLVEDWGGKPPVGSKATNDEIVAFMDLIKTIPSTKLVGTLDILERKFISKKVSKDNCRSYRSAYKDFLKWAETNGYCSEPINHGTDPSKPVTFNRNPKGVGRKTKSNYHGKTCKKAYALMSHNSRGELIYPDDYINNYLQKEIEEYVEFRIKQHGVREVTARKIDVEEFQRTLGWLHRYKKVPLAELRLSSIIWYQDLNDYKNDKTRQAAIEYSNENINLINEYLDFSGGHPKTRIRIAASYIVLAKYIFRNQVVVNNYGIDIDLKNVDLPMIRRLNQTINVLEKEAQATPDSIPYQDKSVTWEEAMDVLERLRVQSDYTHTQWVTRYKNKLGEYKEGAVSSRARNKRSIVDDLQDFLSLAFMLLIPPDRARTYYELEIGRTFKYGIYNSGRFTIANKMKDKSQAEWYINLKPEDYKTGKVYKEYWGLMPNFVFKDGQKLYDYIDRWLTEGRELEQKCNHSYFFRGKYDYGNMNSNQWGSRIIHIFVQNCGVPVTPKEIRKMCITYLYNQKADPSAMESLGYAMHHSSRTQKKDYNSQTQFERIQPIYDLNEKMHKKLLSKDSEHDN
jgi:hypothetical protein